MPMSVASTSHPLLRVRRTDVHRPASLDVRAGDLHDLDTPREVGGHVVLDRLFFTHFVCVISVDASSIGGAQLVCIPGWKAASSGWLP